MKVKDKKDFILRFYALADKIMPPSSGTEDVDEDSAIYKDAFNNFDKYFDSMKGSLRIFRCRIDEDDFVNNQDPDFVGDCFTEVNELQDFLANYQLMQEN